MGGHCAGQCALAVGDEADIAIGPWWLLSVDAKRGVGVAQGDEFATNVGGMGWKGRVECSLWCQNKRRVAREDKAWAPRSKRCDVWRMNGGRPELMGWRCRPKRLDGDDVISHGAMAGYESVKA